MDTISPRARPRISPFVFVAVIVGVSLVLFGESYVVFHTFAELFTALIGLVTFTIAWHTRRVATTDYLTFLGMAFLPVSIVTILHALTFKGVALVPGHDANLPTELWLVARTLQASAFALAAFYISRPLRRPGVVLATYSAVCALLVVAAFDGLLPPAFVEGQGLTTFKVAVEYLVIAVTAGAAIPIVRAKHELDSRVRFYLLVSMAATVSAELIFTLYTDPLAITNRLGHVAHLTAFSFIYFALVEASLETPFATLFKQLAESQRELSEAYSNEHQIAETLQNVMEVQPQNVAGLQVAHRYLPAPGAGRIGGDFYDVFPISGDLVGFSIGDVCGKGLRAAGTTLKARSAIRALALSNSDPAQVLERVNAYLVRELEESSFVTAVYGTIDMHTGQVKVSVAGHPEPIVCGRPDLVLSDKLRTPPLGVLDRLDAGNWELSLDRGESMVLVTDGVLDAQGKSDRFGSDRLRSLLHSIQCADTAEGVVDRVLHEVTSHAQAQPNDDVAVVALRYAPA